MAGEVEILVHIAAPSTSKDDTRYRALASAYLDFHPAREIDLPAAETKALSQALAPDALLSPQASFDNVWDNVRPPPVQPNARQSSSQDEEESGPSWVQPPSEVADSMPNHNLSIPEFNSPGRLLDFYLQTRGPPLDPSQEAGQNDLSVHAGSDDLTTFLVSGGQIAFEGAIGFPLAREASAASRHDDHEGVSALLANRTDAIIHGYISGSAQPGIEPNPSQSTIYEGSTDLNILLARGTNSVLQDDRVPPTPGAAPAVIIIEPNTTVARYGTPQNAITTESQMDESHVSQTPSSPLRSKGVQTAPPSSARSLKQPRARSSDPALASQHSQSELFGVTIPATQLLDRAESEPPSSKRHKPTPLRNRVHKVGRMTSDVLPRGPTSSASPPPRHGPLATGSASHSIDWTSHTHLTSPDPSPATHRLGSRAPPKLEKLMAVYGDRYQPTFPQTTASSSPPTMRTHERGYWLLPLADWPHADRLSAWGFLGNYICRERYAGWGTRACRDEGWAWMRLYGWEHIAGELYMLLYMASLRRLKMMKITWHDGKGEMLIVVGARKEKNKQEWGTVWCEEQAQAHAQAWLEVGGLAP